MNVLEKILEEIKDNSKLGNMRWKSIRIEKVEEIIRSHMDEVTNMSGKRLIDANALDDEVMIFFLLLQEIRSRQQSSENVRNRSEE
nr:MAG TPA: hypothetical protein [Caudoviricetes sp.]